jgi:hypothetical protein
LADVVDDPLAVVAMISKLYVVDAVKPVNVTV